MDIPLDDIHSNIMPCKIFVLLTSDKHYFESGIETACIKTSIAVSVAKNQINATVEVSGVAR